MQTLAEKCEAIKTLLPCLTEHLNRHPAYRIVPAPRWVSGPEPPKPPPQICDGSCATCTQTCVEEAWVREYRRLRRAYPVIKRLEKLLDLKIYYQKHGATWRAAIMGVYVTPWDLMQNAHWLTLANRGIEWLAGECKREVPWYDGPIPQSPDPCEHRIRQVLYLHLRGLSCRRIAQKVGLGKSTVSDILRAHGVRSERKAAAGGG